MLLAGREEEEEVKVVALEPNTRSNIEVAKLPIFNGNTSKVPGFIIVYKLYLRIRMRNILVEEQIQ